MLSGDLTLKRIPSRISGVEMTLKVRNGAPPDKQELAHFCHSEGLSRRVFAWHITSLYFRCIHCMSKQKEYSNFAVTVSDTSEQSLRITDVQIQRNDPGRRSIFINGEFAFGISDVGYQKFALFKGRELSAEELEETRTWEEVDKGKRVSMMLLGRRKRCEKELRDALLEKEISPEAIDKVFSFLKEYSMLDDADFARSFINDQLLRRPLGKNKLRMKLREKGVDDPTAEGALAELIDEGTELEQARKAAEKKMGTIRQKDPLKRKRSLHNFLAYRGFRHTTIRTVIDQLEAEPVSE